MAWLLDWWDAIELWLVQLPYPVQIVLVVGVLLPLCWVATRVVDRVAGVVEDRWVRMRAGRRSAHRNAGGHVDVSPRKRITLALVALILLVVLGWFFRGGDGATGHAASGEPESVRANRTLHGGPSAFTGSGDHRGRVAAVRGEREANVDAGGWC